ncbi:hypothetical protein JCM5350_000729 [Sporobolomyces pararoseus]
MSQQPLQDSPTTSDQLFAFPFSSSSSDRQASGTPSSSWSSSSASSSSIKTTTMELPTPPSYSLFDSEMDHIFHQTIDTSFLDSRPSSPTSFSLPVLEPIGNNLEGRYSKQYNLLSPDCPPHLTLSLPHSSHSTSSSASTTPPRRPHDVETKRQIDVLTTILTSPNLLPTSLPSLPIPARARSRSPSSSSTSPSRAKDEILGSTSMKSQRSWLDALKEAELKAKAKKLAGSTPGFARL